MTGKPRNMVLVDMSLVELKSWLVTLVIGVVCLDSCATLVSINSLLYIASAIAIMAKKMDESVFIDQRVALYTRRCSVDENVRLEDLTRPS